jgi:hypothetical protein
MGVDWDAHLVFGYDLGFPDEVIPYDEEPSWYDPEDDDLHQQLNDALLDKLAGFSDKWTREDTSYWERRSRAEAKIGVEIWNYCSLYERDSAGLILGTKGYRASEDEVAEITSEDLVIDPEWIERLDNAIAALGLKPKNSKPAWLLCALMS